MSKEKHDSSPQRTQKEENKNSRSMQSSLYKMHEMEFQNAQKNSKEDVLLVVS